MHNVQLVDITDRWTTCFGTMHNVRLVDITKGRTTCHGTMHNVQLVDITDGRATVAEPYIMYRSQTSLTVRLLVADSCIMYGL